MPTNAHSKHAAKPMPKSTAKLTLCSPLDSTQIAWLNSLGFVPDKPIRDCNVTERTITFEDGTVRQVTERYERVMGYHRPIDQWNKGKQAEHRERLYFSNAKAGA
jgi:hypothetical protein